MKNQKTVSLLMAALVLIGVTSCAGGDAKTPVVSDVTSTEPAETEAAVAAPAYPYEIQDFGGYEFRILNVLDNMWAAEGSNNSAKLDFEHETGEIIEDAVYNMMRSSEDTLNIRFAPIDKSDVFELVQKVNKVVMAGDDVYDAAYICTSNYASALGITMNLYDIASIHLEEAWWHPVFVESMTFGDSYLYGAMDYINRWTWEAPGCVLFNKDMMKTHNLEIPYDAVRAGTWSYDMMYDMMKKVVNLNGASDFTPQKGGVAIYGQAANHEESPLLMMQGTGYNLVTKDADNMPMLVEDLTAYINVYDKLSEICSEKGYSVLINTPELIGDHIFKEGRALFNWETASEAMNCRNVEFEYGLVPMPKYDENQTQYYSPVRQYGMLLTVPLTNADPERTGTILDYMSWYGYNNIQPVVWEAMCYKGVRDEDSIDMLEIIFSSMYVDIGFMWDITKELQTQIALNAANGVENVASLLEKRASANARKLDNLMDKLTVE